MDQDVDKKSPFADITQAHQLLKDVVDLDDSDMKQAALEEGIRNEGVGVATLLGTWSPQSAENAKACIIYFLNKYRTTNLVDGSLCVDVDVTEADIITVGAYLVFLFASDIVKGIFETLKISRGV